MDASGVMKWGDDTARRVCNSLNFNFRETDDEAVIQIMRSPQAFKQLIAAFNREDLRLKRTGKPQTSQQRRGGGGPSLPHHNQINARLNSSVLKPSTTPMKKRHVFPSLGQTLS